MIVPEHNSSQKCPKCFGQLQIHKPGKGVRIKECQNGCKSTADENGAIRNFAVNRDFSAPMNFLAIAIGLVWHGKRPSEFRP